MNEVLATETVRKAPEEVQLRLTTGSKGERLLLLGDTVLASEGDDQVALIARMVMGLPATVGSVAWLGGGFCIGPRLMNGRARSQAVYELREPLSRFCPRGVTFIPGDWQTTISGSFDVIVYDLGGDVPRETLERHLATGGMILS